MATPDDIYNQALAIINGATGYANTQITQSQSYTQGAIDAANAEQLAALSILVPAPILPAIPSLDTDQDLEAEFINQRNQMWSGLETWVQDVMAGWMNQWTPKLDARIQPSADNFMWDVLTNGRTGLPIAVENQMWDRMRARNAQDSLLHEQEAIDSYAARGFSLPPGALAARMLDVQEASTISSAGANREITIKQAEMTLQVSIQSLQITTQLRLGVASAIASFFSAALQLPGQATSAASTAVDKKQLLWTMIDAYLRGKFGVSNLDWQQKLKQADVNVATSQVVQQDRSNRRDAIIRSAVAGAEAAAAVAAAAINSQQTLANVGYQGDVSQTVTG